MVTLGQNRVTATPSRSALGDLIRQPGIAAAVIASRDGFVIDSAATDIADPEAVGAAITSLVGDAEMLSHELGFGKMGMAMVEFDDSILIIAPLDDEALLAVVARSNASLGTLRHQIRRALPDIARSI